MCNMNDVLNRIQTLLNEKEWTLYRLAKESGITYSSLSSLFKKDNQPTISTLEKICTGLNISLNEFFSNYPPYREHESYSNDEKELIQIYKQLNHKDKILLVNFAKLLNEPE